MGIKSLRYRPNIDVAELMVQFTLPKNSKIAAGKTWARLAGGRNPREYRVYRWNPDDGKNPRMDTYFVDLDDCGPMVLDALMAGRPAAGAPLDHGQPRRGKRRAAR